MDEIWLRLVSGCSGVGSDEIDENGQGGVGTAVVGAAGTLTVAVAICGVASRPYSPLELAREAVKGLGTHWQLEKVG